LNPFRIPTAELKPESPKAGKGLTLVSHLLRCTLRSKIFERFLDDKNAVTTLAGT
jgi:hypothetical protein